MRQLIVVVAILSILFVAACNGRASITPTPFPTAAPTLTPGGQGPVILTLPELAAAPGLYRDTVIQLTGRLQKQPLLVCNSEPHYSPAGWGLAEEGIVALAGGYDQQVRTLLPTDLLMTVEGRWRRWEGLVGCGKQAHPQEIWFLEVSRILSPSPITQVTLTPAAGDETTEIGEIPPTPAGQPTEEFAEFPTPETLATPEFPEATLPPEGYPATTGEPFPEDLAATETVPVTQTLIPGQTPVLTSLPPATVTVPSQSGTPGANPTATLSGTLPTATPTATATGGAPGQVIEKGDLFEDLDEEFASTVIESAQIHSWTIELFEDEQLSVYAIAPAPGDVTLSLLKDGQTLINRQNNAPAGAAEFIVNPSLPGDGVYTIHVAVEGANTIEYAIVANTDPDFPIVFNGIIVSGSPRSAVSLPADAVHYWFFTGNTGQSFSLTLTPAGAVDPAVDFYGPGAEYIDSVDDGLDGDEEEYETTLPATGMYAIRVTEYNGAPMAYDLEITLQ